MKTVVFVCSDAPNIHLQGAEAVAIEGLCKSPDHLADWIGQQPGEVERVVMLLHESHYDLAAVQKALRSAEMDPLGVQILEAPSGMPQSELEVAVAGLKSRAVAFAGSRPEQHKPVRSERVSRRALFMAPQPFYLATPMVDHELCAAADGCRACVDVCPQDAYRWHQGRIHFNKDICEPCGRCVSGCPTEAIANPSATPEMLAAQIRTLIDRSAKPVGIRFVCSRANSVSYAPGWYDVSVPCTGMIPGTWLLTALLMGAGSVGAVSCSEGGCPLKLDDHRHQAIDFARSILRAASFDPERVPSDAGGGEITGSMGVHDISSPFTRAADVETMLALDSLSATMGVVVHEGSGLGVVSIDAEACTLCAQCAQTCPTEAIVADYEGETVGLFFDATACTNCRQCTIACPEIERGAIAVEGRVDPALLRSERQAINQGTVLVCESCGKPIAPAPLMNRIGELLGDDFNDTMAYLTRRCIDCRSLA